MMVGKKTWPPGSGAYFLFIFIYFFFHVLICLLSYCCVCWILSDIVITILWKREVDLLFFFFGLSDVSHGLFALLLSIIGRLCSVIVHPGHLLY